MRTKQMERIWIENGPQPWIVIFTAEVDGDYAGREEVARYNFYSKYGYIKLTHNFDERKEYKGFKPLLNALFKIDERLSWDTRMVDNAKKAAKQEEKKVLREAEERHAKTEEETKEEQSTAEEQPEQQANNTYTAYNRSFPTYEEAIQYCIESDFDPAFIEVVAHPTTSQNGSLKMDLQLFGTPTETEIKPFKQPYATYKEGVSKFGIGKHLELVYTLETTMADPEQDTRYYSNIHKYEFNNLQSALERFNLYQQLGYHNLQLWTEIRYKGETIIENGTSGQIEFLVNDSRLKKATETEKENERIKQQIEQYESFIKHFKAESAFKKFLEDEIK